jgi:hypothetical protein
MNKYLIRFNKSRGMPGRGTMDHVWRIFENEKEYLVKHFKIEVPSFSEQTGPGIVLQPSLKEKSNDKKNRRKRKLIWL